MSVHSEIIKAGRRIEVPMRWGAAESQAKGFVTDVLETWFSFVGKLIQLLTGQNTLSNVSKGLLPMRPHPPECLCCGNQTIKKDAGSDELLQMRAQLTATFNANDLAAFDSLWDNVFGDLFKSPDALNQADAVFNRWFLPVYNQGLAQAYSDGKNAVNVADPVMRHWFKRNVSEGYTVDYSSQYVNQIINQGFTTVKHVISQKFKGKAMHILLDGITGGTPWSDIAMQMYEDIGVGSLFHWERIVRTEMLKAYDLASRERYRQMRANYVRFSITAGACKICRAILEKNQGYYRLADAPSLPGATHPLCRCRWMPKFRLPASVKL